MKRDERRQAIMDLLVGARAVDLDDLADRFAVSRMTIHRDLDDLEQAGLLRKVRGGATIEAGTQFESDFRIRALQDSDAKARMARAALDLVEPGMTVMVNDGSMAALLGANLVDKAPHDRHAGFHQIQRRAGHAGLCIRVLQRADAEVAFELGARLDGGAAAHLAQQTRLLQVVEIPVDGHARHGETVGQIV